MSEQGFMGQPQQQARQTGQPNPLSPNSMPYLPNIQSAPQPYNAPGQQAPAQPSRQSSYPYSQIPQAQQPGIPQQIFYDPYGRPFYFDRTGTPIYCQPETTGVSADQPQGARSRSTRPLAVTAFVLGLVSLLLSITPLAMVSWLLGLVALILGVVALALPVKKPRKGKAFAIIGIVLGVASGLLAIVMFNAYYTSFSTDYSPTTNSSSSPSASSSPRSSSPSASSSFDAADYASVPYEDVARDPDAYKNKKLVFMGSVVQTLEGSTNEMRLAIDEDYSNMVYVTYKPSLADKRVLEGDTIRVYGTCSGLYEYTSVMKVQVNIPGLTADKIEQVTKEEKSKQIANQYGVTIDSLTPATNYDGQPAAIVSLTFSNNSGKPTSFSSALEMQAFQNGIELDDAFMLDEPSYDSGSALKDVKPGSTITVQHAFLLSGDSDVTVEIRLRSYLDSETLITEKTFSI